MQKKYSNSVRIFFPKFSREDVIKEIGRCVGELHGKLGLERVILFGSYAKGTYTVASDVDLLIVFDDGKSNENEVYREMMRNIRLQRLELHIIPKRDLEAYRTTKWMNVIEEEGVKIL